MGIRKAWREEGARRASQGMIRGVLRRCRSWLGAFMILQGSLVGVNVLITRRDMVLRDLVAVEEVVVHFLIMILWVGCLVDDAE